MLKSTRFATSHFQRKQLGSIDDYKRTVGMILPPSIPPGRVTPSAIDFCRRKLRVLDDIVFPHSMNSNAE
jgi:hypothetical protein